MTLILIKVIALHCSRILAEDDIFIALANIFCTDSLPHREYRMTRNPATGVLAIPMAPALLLVLANLAAVLAAVGAANPASSWPFSVACPDVSHPDL